MSGKVLQTAILEELREIAPHEWVAREWSVRKEAQDTFFDPASYAPRLDVAVGPFNSTFEGRWQDANSILSIDCKLSRFLDEAIQSQNEVPFQNPNPRCLIAIEIEYSTSSKHILGGITNASMLGRFGVMVAPEDSVAKIRRIHTYVTKLREVGKASPEMFGNIACFTSDEFIRIVRAARTTARATERNAWK